MKSADNIVISVVVVISSVRAFEEQGEYSSDDGSRLQRQQAEATTVNLWQVHFRLFRK